MTRSPGWTPNYKAFLVTGAVLGFLAGAALAVVRPPSGAYSQGSEIGYVGLFGAVIGMAVAGAAALVADSIGRRSIPPAEAGRPTAPGAPGDATTPADPAGSPARGAGEADRPQATPTDEATREEGPPEGDADDEARGGRDR